MDLNLKNDELIQSKWRLKRFGKVAFEKNFFFMKRYEVKNDYLYRKCSRKGGGQNPKLGRARIGFPSRHSEVQMLQRDAILVLKVIGDGLYRSGYVDMEKYLGRSLG